MFVIKHHFTGLKAIYRHTKPGKVRWINYNGLIVLTFLLKTRTIGQSTHSRQVTLACEERLACYPGDVYTLAWPLKLQTHHINHNCTLHMITPSFLELSRSVIFSFKKSIDHFNLVLFHFEK